MSRLFETIRVIDGQLQNLIYHNHRLNTSRKAVFGTTDIIQLENIIQVPENCRQGIYKCKIVYSDKPEEVIFEQYTPRVIKSLKVIIDDTITYSFKYTDRTQLDALYAKRGQCDEILIVKNGFVTDTSYSNIVFFNGKKWLTPATPLLKGTMANSLIRNGVISAEEIKVTDLEKFQKVRLINAMLPFDSGIDIDICKICI